jgi:hypothetical protein
MLIINVNLFIYNKNNLNSSFLLKCSKKINYKIVHALFVQIEWVLHKFYLVHCWEILHTSGC